ncbi:cyclopropane-fatty-acyl-phospholipid synthase family protein [Mycobacterium sp. pUA109]|uniref:cyclopropane-fatty-acyl-phospholipid synthase family protein n=1 Tax=Mycobacterium sp. pUA109 TaxID=3238982 RepID=UPI00351B263F
MSRQDRLRWDDRYAGRGAAPVTLIGPPPVFLPHQHLFPTAGHALELACGQGLAAVWLARRGLDVVGVDVSPVAIDQARKLARRSGVGDRCRLEVVDLDGGLPPGPPADVIVCHKFRDRRLDQAIIARLAPGGLLAISALSEVGAVAGPFRASAGELPAAFTDLELIDTGEGGGEAWLLARAPLPTS